VKGAVVLLASAGAIFLGISAAAESDSRAPRCNGKEATVSGISGTSRDDVIVGTGASDEIKGNGGSDLICGKGGHDALIGGLGNDTIFGGLGRDYLTGQDGNDHLLGQRGDESPDPSTDPDPLVPHPRIFGNEGDDVLGGGPGDDNLSGDIGRDRLSGASGHDFCGDRNAKTEFASCEVVHP
jgi:Ca2+-binding RTX toxin-like protein